MQMLLTLFCVVGLVRCDLAPRPVLTYYDGYIHVAAPGLPGAVSVSVTIIGAENSGEESGHMAERSVGSKWRGHVPAVKPKNGEVHYIMTYHLPDTEYTFRGTQQVSREDAVNTAATSLSSQRYLRRRASTVFFDDFSSGQINPSKWTHTVNAGWFDTVAESYKRLLWLVDITHFPKDYEPPTSYAVLMYELHYHLGVALQRLDQHRKAIVQFTKAIESVSIPKGGCLAGCVANSCLMTPILARRAYAYTKVGDLRSALRDAENSVVLDNQNPDVYCIRALVRGSRDEESLAAKDVDDGLKLNPSHVCALIIRGALHRTLAEKLNPESQSFYTVTDFSHPCMLDFYDRFLFTLSVPHTITEINLTPDKPSPKQLDSNPDLCSRSPSRISSAHSSSAIREASEPFRCGTPAPRDNKSAARRRKDYGEAVRKFMARPKTASEFLAQLEKERTKQSILESQRASSTIYSPQSRRISSAAYPSHISQQSPDHVTPSASPYSRKSSVTSPGKTSLSPNFLLPPAGHQAAEKQSERSGSLSFSTLKASFRLEVETKTTSGRTTKTSATKTFTFETPSNYTIPVFQPLNIKDAPRMYYRPWRGDKLPVGDVPHPGPAPAFY